MGRRGRRTRREAGRADGLLAAATSDFTDAEGNVLTLRDALSAGSRREVTRALGGSPLSREDAWQRAIEILFERLAVRWTIAGVPTEGQRELLGRFRLASSDERAWVRSRLREHCAEHFPELETP